MLNFKLKSNAINKNSDSPLSDYLRSLGIQEVDEFIKTPSKKNEISGRFLDNSILVIEKLAELFEQKKKFFLVVDCDTDGFTSSAIFYNYFKSVYPSADIQWVLHEEKQHGIELDKIPSDREVIIVPDAGSNQIFELDTLSAQSKYVFVIDHHQVESYPVYKNDFVTIVNNQSSPNFSNKALSGAGVVFKIVQLFDEVYGYNFSADLYDLAALGIIADCMDSRTLDNNYIIYKGLNNIQNKMFKALIDKQVFYIKNPEKPTKMDIAFYIGPLINGTIRMGSMEDKVLLFRGFIEQNHSEYYEHIWRGSKSMEDFYHRSARIAYNVKNEQNRMKMKCLEFLQKRIEAQGLDKNKIIAVITNEDDEIVVPKTITGLVAMELLKLYNKPSLVLRPTVDNEGNISYSGSGRSNSYEELPSFLNFVRDQEESVFAQGHACAFGCSIKAEEFNHFIESCNNKMAHIDFDNDTYYVDVVFNNNVNRKLVYEFALGEHIYGNQIPEPMLALTTIITPSDIMIMGADRSSVRITIQGVPCIKFKDADLVKKLQSIGRAQVTIVGKPKMNNYKGVDAPQINIIDIEITPVQSGGLF